MPQEKYFPRNMLSEPIKRKAMLNEETYDLKKLQPLFKKVRRLLDEGKIGEKFFVTEYFKDFIPEGAEIKILLNLNDSETDPNNRTARGQAVGVFDIISVEINTSVLKENNTEKMKNGVIKVLKHEVVHALDYLRSLKKNGEIKLRFKAERGIPKSSPASKEEKLLRYIGSSYELNTVINAIKHHKKKNDAVWKRFDKASNKEKIKILIEVFIIKDSESDKKKVQTTIDKTAKEAIKTPWFYNRVLKRLHREGLISKNINEETYDISNLNSLYKEVEKVIEEGKYKKTINVTKYFRNFIPKEKKATVRIVLNPDLNKKYGGKSIGGDASGDGTTVTISLNTSSIRDNPDSKIVRERLIKILTHETIHAIDLLRSLEKNDTIKERNKKTNSIVDTTTAGGWLKYMSNDYELNTTINTIKAHKKRKDLFWKKFKEANNENKVRLFVYSFMTTSLEDNISRTTEFFIKIVADAAVMNTKFSNKVLKRLHREGLLNNNKMALKEETYDLDKLEPIVKEVRKKINKRTTDITIDATKYFKDFIPEGKEAKVLVMLDSLMATKVFGDGVTLVEKDDENTLKIIINTLPLVFFGSKKIKEKLTKVFRHEMVHALDYLRSLEKSDTIRGRRAKTKDIKSYPTEEEGWMDYLGDSYEINTTINAIKNYKDNNTDFWKNFSRVSNRDKIRLFVFAFSGYITKEGVEKEAGENTIRLANAAVRTPWFYKKILKRLHREGLLNNNEELKEETYDLSSLKPFFKFVEQALEKLETNKTFTATHFFRKFIPEGVNAKVIVQIDPFTLNHRHVRKSQNSFTRGRAAAVGSDTLYIFINSYYLLRPESVDRVSERMTLIRTLKHEAIHAIDFLRSLDPKKHKEGKKIIISMKGSKRKKKGIKDTRSYINYISNLYEFNVAVNLFKSYLKNNPDERHRFYNDLSDIEKVQKFVEVFYTNNTNKNITGDFFYNETLKDIKKEVAKDKDFVKKVIRRLYRENMLENTFESKVKGFLKENE